MNSNDIIKKFQEVFDSTLKIFSNKNRNGVYYYEFEDAKGNKSERKISFAHNGESFLIHLEERMHELDEFHSLHERRIDFSEVDSSVEDIRSLLFKICMSY